MPNAGKLALQFCKDMIKNLKQNVRNQKSRISYRDAQRRFAARFCSHGIVDTGWCEDCHGDNCPVLTGQDAENFLKSMEGTVMTPDRMKYLQDCAEASKKAEVRK